LKFPDRIISNREDWEFAFIFEALNERGLLREGKTGLGFACGKEPLPSIFASCGCRIVATDLFDEASL
jgi:hypothetical protein